MIRAYRDEAKKLGNDASLKTNRGKKRTEPPPEDVRAQKKEGAKDTDNERKAGNFSDETFI